MGKSINNTTVLNQDTSFIQNNYISILSIK